MMMVTIHQPEHLPWTGFFHKMAQADQYVLLDTVQFTKNNWQNRNRLIDRQGTVFWATVPVLLQGHTDSTIADILINNAENWRRKYWGRLEQSYCRHRWYARYHDELREIFFRNHVKLVDLNIELIEFFRRELGIKTPVVRSSELGVTGKRTELLLNVCNKLGASSYLSGPSGKDYLNASLFESEGVGIQYHEFSPPTYDAPAFIPGLSILDLLLNHGPESPRILGVNTNVDATVEINETTSRQTEAKNGSLHIEI